MPIKNNIRELFEEEKFNAFKDLREFTWRVLQMYWCTGRLVNVVKNFYEKRKSRVRVEREGSADEP